MHGHTLFFNASRLSPFSQYATNKEGGFRHFPGDGRGTKSAFLFCINCCKLVPFDDETKVPGDPNSKERTARSNHKKCKNPSRCDHPSVPEKKKVRIMKPSRELPFLSSPILSSSISFQVHILSLPFHSRAHSSQRPASPHPAHPTPRCVCVWQEAAPPQQLAVSTARTTPLSLHPPLRSHSTTHSAPLSLRPHSALTLTPLSLHSALTPLRSYSALTPLSLHSALTLTRWCT